MAYTHCQACERYFHYPDAQPTPPRFCSDLCFETASAKSQRRIPWMLISVLALAGAGAAVWNYPAPPGAAVFDNVPPLRPYAARWLGRSGPEGVARLVERVTSPDQDAVLYALDGLITSPDAGAADALRKLRRTLDPLLAGASLDLKNQALRAIGRAADPVDFEILAGALGDRTTRAGAIAGLGYTGDERARSVLGKILIDGGATYDADTDRPAAARALASSPGQIREAIGALAQGIADPSLPVRMGSLSAMEPLLSDYLDLKVALSDAPDDKKIHLRQLLGSVEAGLTAIRAQQPKEADQAFKERLAKVYYTATGTEIAP